MMTRLERAGRWRDHASRDFASPRGRQPTVVRPCQGDSLMQWQTPTAVDYRFGFEITLYISAR